MSSFISNFLALAAIYSGISVIITKNPVISVIWLISVFVFSSVYLMNIGIYFVGVSYLIVYVGAVAVLFIFVIMIINIQINDIVSISVEYTKSLPLGTIVAVIFFSEIFIVLTNFVNTIEIKYFFNNFNNFIIGNNNNFNITFINEYFNNFNTNFFIHNQIKTLGEIIYINGSLWLFVVSVILLLGIIGPIVLCMKTKNSLKF
jgi:NADH-ubiquinone oxidoreductase chain 6